MLGGRLVDALLEGFHVLGPELPLGDVRGRELPVLGLVVDSLEEALLLLVESHVEEDLEDPVAVLPEVLLEVADLPVATVEELVLVHVDGALGHGVAVLEGVDAHDEHVLVVAAVEEADVAALGQMRHGAPEVVVGELLLGGLLEAVDVHALGVHAAHDVLDGGVLARGVHGLEQHDHALVSLGVELVLEFGHADVVLLGELLVAQALVLVDVRRRGIVADLEMTLAVEAAVAEVHLAPLVGNRCRHSIRSQLRETAARRRSRRTAETGAPLLADCSGPAPPAAVRFQADLVPFRSLRGPARGPK